MAVQVTGIDHLYITVTSLDRSEAFYDPLMEVLGFRKGTTPIDGERHLHYFNPVTQYTIRRARNVPNRHDCYSPGLHHVCFRVPDQRDVDEVAARLQEGGVEVSGPRFHPEYASDYYAAFFRDPDGVRLEVVAHRRLRSLIRDHWEELTEFEEPLRKAGLL